MYLKVFIAYVYLLAAAFRLSCHPVKIQCILFTNKQLGVTLIPCVYNVQQPSTLDIMHSVALLDSEQQIQHCTWLLCAL